MSTLLIGLIIILSVIIVCGVLIAVNANQSKKRKIKFLHQFSEVGAKNNLSFTRQEVLHNRVIGLDGIHRKIVVVEEKDDLHEFLIIDLSEIKSCRARKIYQHSGWTTSKNQQAEEHLHSIVLQFDYKTAGKEQAHISFFQNHINSVYEINDLYHKAKDWETFVQKMISRTSDELVA